MQLLDRRRTMNSKGGLPYDAEIEYLEGTGTQYIDCGFKAKTTTKVEVKFNLGVTATQAIYGSVVNTKYGMFFGTGANSSVFCNFTDNAVSPTTTLSSNTDYTIIQKGTSLKINGTSYTVTNTQATTNNIIIFARNYMGTIQRMITGKIYYFKLFDDNDNIVMDFIPVRKGQVGYLYDRVSKQLFGNSGTGDFVLGNDIVEVEYLETSGTQYINTGIKPSSNTTFDIDAYIPNHGTQGFWVFGSRVSGNAGQFAYLNDGDRNEKSWRFGSAVSVVTPKLSEGWHHFNNTETPRVLKIDSNITLTANANTFAQTNYPIYLFTLNVGGTPATANIAVGARIGNVKIYESGVLVFDGIPVRVGTTGYMLDKVEHKLYGNAGTGSFVLGNDKNA